MWKLSVWHCRKGFCQEISDRVSNLAVYVLLVAFLKINDSSEHFDIIGMNCTFSKTVLAS